MFVGKTINSLTFSRFWVFWGAAFPKLPVECLWHLALVHWRFSDPGPLGNEALCLSLSPLREFALPALLLSHSPEILGRDVRASSREWLLKHLDWVTWMSFIWLVIDEHNAFVVLEVRVWNRCHWANIKALAELHFFWKLWGEFVSLPFHLLAAIHIPGLCLQAQWCSLFRSPHLPLSLCFHHCLAFSNSFKDPCNYTGLT